MGLAFKSIVLACLGLGVRGAQWAVLIAGSNTWGNYRHQADICHAYQIVHANGIPDSNIITFFYDDLAANSENPYPGKVYNKPTAAGVAGTDVYAGCKKSYTGLAVNASNFLAVITGNKSAVMGGSGEVLESTSDDEVFINYSDHGAVGLVAMPTGPYLYATDLMTALNTMYAKKMYSKLVFYLESCESGSMFANLPPGISVYATTAANPSESSYGTYCPPQDFIDGKELGTCLGDLYSVNWMEDSDQTGHMSETLLQQFQLVQQETNLSHVMKYGDMTFTGWDIGVFQGDMTPPTVRTMPSLLRKHVKRTATGDAAKSSNLSSRMATITSLQTRHAVATGALKAELKAQLDKELHAKTINDAAFRLLASTEFGGKSLAQVLATNVDVTQWDCYKAANAQMASTACGAYTDYTFQYARMVAMMCENNGGAANKVISHVRAACKVAKGKTA